MTFFGQSDLQEMFAGMGGHDLKLASIGSGTTKGYVDIIDEALLQDGSLNLGGATTKVTIETGSLVGLDVGSELIDVTDSVHYRVQQFNQIGDGAVTEIYAARL